LKNAFLVGEKVYLRPIEEADLEAFPTWFNDGEVTRFLRRDRPYTIEQAREWFERRNKSDGRDVPFAVVERETDRVVGETGLYGVDPVNRQAEVGIAIGDKEAWGKGYGTEVVRLLVRYGFERLNLHRVGLDYVDGNERGRRAYERAGFREEGRRREKVWRDGEYRDLVLMGVLRREWEAAG